MSIVAALDKVLFFNASSKYSVLRMKTEDSSVPTEARSPYRYHDHLIRFTAVGIELPQTDTVKIEMDGEWKDGKYGLQLQVDHWQEIVPPTLEGVRNYLASGLLKGIGEKTADAIIEKFGVNALKILEHQPDRLLEIRGITKERLAEIKDAYAETSRMRVLMTLLAPFKVTPTTAQKIQHSRITTFEQYLTAMDIPMVGSTASKAICQRFRGNLAEFETAVCQSFDFTQLPDFGETLHRNIHQWFHSEENWTIWTELRRLVCIKTYQPPAASTDMGNPFVGKTLVVTGKVEPYTRDGINEKIESLGAHAGSSVSSKTDYLICGENAGSKLAKAQEFGIKILSPDEFFRMAGESA